MTAFLEKVARGICHEMYGPFDSMGERDKVKAMSAARAAVEAMRMPNEAMVEAGENDGGHSVYRWQAMIGAALGEI